MDLHTSTVNIKDDLSEQNFFFFFNKKSHFFMNMCLMSPKYSQTIHAASFCPPSISSSLHSPFLSSLQHPQIPNEQEAALGVAKSRGPLSWLSKWHSLLNQVCAHMCACLQARKTYNCTLSSEMFCFLGERAWREAGGTNAHIHLLF